MTTPKPNKFVSADQLLCDLSLREWAKEKCSFMGGNPIQLFFLMTHDVINVNYSSSIENSFVSKNNNELTLNVRSGTNIAAVRKALNIFQDKNPNLFKQIAFEDFTNYVKVTSFGIKSKMIDSFIETIELTTKLDETLSKNKANQVTLSQDKVLDKKQLDIFEKINVKPTYEIIICFRNIIGMPTIMDYSYNFAQISNRFEYHLNVG